MNHNIPQQVFAGTDWGVYYTDDVTADSPTWFRFDNGMPHTMIWDMQIDRGATTLSAWTRGRGAWVYPLRRGRRLHRRLRRLRLRLRRLRRLRLRHRLRHLHLRRLRRLLASATSASAGPVPRAAGARSRLGAAKRKIRARHCSVGLVRHARSRRSLRGRVIRQNPRPGALRRRGFPVNLVVGRG